MMMVMVHEAHLYLLLARSLTMIWAVHLPTGIMLCLGPFNYPFNETYATLIPALLAGNIVIMKIPNLGGLAHMLTMEVYRDCFPRGN